MKTNLFKPYYSRQAFTLIELIVVLTILVGLAGVLVPTVTNMLCEPIAAPVQSTSPRSLLRFSDTKLFT